MRNFYAGVLLLAKEVLARAAPDVDPKNILSERYKPVLGSEGKLIFKPASERTIDFATLNERFKDFGLEIDGKALRDLNRIRKDVEHYYTDQPREALREAIAKAFPVVANLFRLAEEEPRSALGETWTIMLEVKELYYKELEQCQATFNKIDWKSSSLSDAPFNCPTCRSDLVAQNDPENTDHQLADCKCRACGAEISAEDAVTSALRVHFRSQAYDAAKGECEAPVSNCPDCGVAAYIYDYEENGCAWCQFELGNCSICSTSLLPNDVWYDNSELCSYCGNMLSKGD